MPLVQLTCTFFRRKSLNRVLSFQKQANYASSPGLNGLYILSPLCDLFKVENKAARAAKDAVSQPYSSGYLPYDISYTLQVSAYYYRRRVRLQVTDTIVL